MRSRKRKRHGIDASSDTVSHHHLRKGFRDTARPDGIHRAKSGKLNPRDAKIILAKSIIAVYHNVQAADEAETRFKLIFSKKDIPDDIPEIQVSPGILNLPQFMKQHNLADSLSEARRLLQQNAVKIDGDKYTLEDYNVTSTIVLQVGKRKFLKLTV